MRVDERSLPTRSSLVRSTFASVACFGVAFSTMTAIAAVAAPAPPRPNVLLIAIDDLNDWVGVFGGNAQSLTPHLDRLAAIRFQRAYCPGPECGPSRSALLSGFMPHRTGVYSNSRNMRRSPLVQTHATLPEYFAQHGYRTLSRGKIFHPHVGDTPGTSDEGQWAFETWENATGDDRVDPARVYSRAKAMLGGQPDPEPSALARPAVDLTWGPIRGDADAMRDSRTAQWAAEQLARPAEARPFFLAVGIHQPHLPWHVPQEFFDRHPLEAIRLPEHRLDDLDDIRDAQGRPYGDDFRAAAEDFQWARRTDELFKRAVQAYLAACSYADACAGTILDALERSPHRDDTIIVVFGDHGWHLGEKLRFRKATLWAEATRLPLWVRTPEMTAARDCSRVVNLIDLFPTLVELCGLPPKPGLDGRSLAPLVRDPQFTWPHVSLTIKGPGSAAVCDERWYLIERPEGANELYDMTADPLQWTNLVASSETAAIEARERLTAFVPTAFAPPVASTPGAKSGPPDPTLKATRDLSRLQ